LTSGAIIFPLTFILTDIAAEVYGYQVARQIIWVHLPATLFYLSLLYVELHIQPPQNWLHQSDYSYIFHGTTLIGLLGNLGVIIGFMVNIFAISKWKILVRGKYFWLRSIGASSIGELIQLTVGMLGALYLQLWPFNEWLNIFISIYALRLLSAGILSIPATLIIIILKKLEGVDIYDYNTNFNPFKIAIQ